MSYLVLIITYRFPGKLYRTPYRGVYMCCYLYVLLLVFPAATGTDLRSEPLLASGRSHTLSISQVNSSPLSWLQLHCQPSRTVSTELHLRKGFAADCLPLLVHQSRWFLGKWHTMLGTPFLIYRESGQIPHGNNQRHLAKDVLPRGAPHSLLVLTEPTPVTSGCLPHCEHCTIPP